MSKPRIGRGQSRVDAGNECMRSLDLIIKSREVAALPPPKPTRFSIGARVKTDDTSGLERRGLRPHLNA
ncbi:MAG: hypothetical protein CR217_18235 [Beijerinckiaceae bacterium]|nr:MAG: hypothetical protein CR217_18235 [Beijerinckiaceae bacterium]